MDFSSSLPEVQVKKIGNICSIIRWRIHSTGTDPVMAQPYKDLGHLDDNFLDYVPEELKEQPDNSFEHLSCIVAATQARMRFAAVLSMGGSAIVCRSLPIPCSDRNSNRNDITSIPNVTSIENIGLVDGSTIVEGAMSLGGLEWCHWSDLGFPMNAILFKVSLIYYNSSKCNRTDGLLKSVLKYVKS